MVTKLGTNQGSQETPSEDMHSTQTLGLPEELLIMVFSKMPTSSMATNSRVCKDWNRLINDNDLWKFFLERDFHNSTKTENPKQLYRSSCDNSTRIHLIKSIFPSKSTATPDIPVPQNDVIAFALNHFNKIQYPVHQLEVFSAILGAVNSTDSIAKQFYDGLPIRIQNEFKRMLWMNNGCSSVRAGHDHGAGFGDYMVHHEIRSLQLSPSDVANWSYIIGKSYDKEHLRNYNK